MRSHFFNLFLRREMDIPDGVEGGEPLLDGIGRPGCLTIGISDTHLDDFEQIINKSKAAEASVVEASKTLAKNRSGDNGTAVAIMTNQDAALGNFAELLECFDTTTKYKVSNYKILVLTYYP